MSDSGEAPFEYQFREVSGVVVIELIGVFTPSLEDRRSFKDMVAERLAENRRLFLMNLAGVHFVNSAGIGAIVVSWKMVRDVGGEFQVCEVRGRVRNVFMFTGVPIITIHDSCAEALREFIDKHR